MEVPSHLVILIKHRCASNTSYIRIGSDLSHSILVQIWVWYALFRKAKQTWKDVVSVNGGKINNLKHANDTVFWNWNWTEQVPVDKARKLPAVFRSINDTERKYKTGVVLLANTKDDAKKKLEGL